MVLPDSGYMVEDKKFEFSKAYNEMKFDIETGKAGITAGFIGELLLINKSLT